nr:glycoside hydrolase family 13 protein [Bacilli bacterium]
MSKKRTLSLAVILAMTTSSVTLLPSLPSFSSISYAKSISSTALSNQLFHDSYQALYRSPFGADPTGQAITLRLLGPSSMTSASIALQNVNNNINDSATILMHKASDALLRQAVGTQHVLSSYSLWEGTIPAADVKVPGILAYNFIAHAGKAVAYYGDNGNGYGGPGTGAPTPDMIVPYHITVYANSFTTPSWFDHGIIYEIFPDRFYNGNPKNDENPSTQTAIGTLANGQEGLVPIQFHKHWNSQPNDPNVVANPSDKNYAAELKARGNGSWSTDFFGGDLQGIIDKLPYLQKLGVTTLYLTPIFQAPSNHKYDTSNFFKIDPGFGTLATFKKLLVDAKAKNMHVVLDGVFEDTGSDSVYFNKYGNFTSIGAWQQYQSPKKVKSPYYSWYQWSPAANPPYIGWSGVDTLPLTNTSNPSYQQFIYGKYDPKAPTNPATNSVARYWFSLGTSGWRLDSANNSNYSVAWWSAFRKAVKQTDPNAIIIGEDWNDPTNDNGVDWMTGTTWDSTMNYLFRNDVISFFAGNYNDGSVQNYAMNAQTFGSSLMQMLEEFPKPAMYAEMNLLGTHDTERILTILEGAPDATMTTPNQQYFYHPTAKQTAIGVQKLELVTDFQYGFVGVPMIYYGDEAGMIGYKDPLDRGTYPWGNANQTLINHYTLLGKIRNDHPVLQSGNYQQLYAKGSVFAFARTIRHGTDALGAKAANATAVVVINNGPSKTITIPIHTLVANGTVLKDALHGQKTYTVEHDTVMITLPAYDGAMLFTR